MIVRGVLGVMAVLALGACSSGNDTAAGGDSPATTSSAPTSEVPSGTPMEEPSTPTPTPTPTPSFPTAKDGQNYAACSDGNCEVLIRKAATLKLDGKKVAVTVVDEAIKLKGPSFDISVKGNGMSSWGSMGGPMHSAAVKAADGATAILILRTRG
ncbi:hypothetical protein AB0F43_33130 [Kribbella sp. NPDC023972]|uniref:hypothetical protein n=1 Tax=Kribbella sp. NPDC023972 TaxID=3154795 RepID=UPI0033E08A82